MEVMLLEESKEDVLPESLKNLFKFATQEKIVLDINDVAAFLVYILMLETGFVSVEYGTAHPNTSCDFNYKRLLMLTCSLPQNWKNSNSYKMQFVLGSFIHHCCTISILVASDDIIINCTVKNLVNASYCMLLDPSLYIIKSTVAENAFIFQNLNCFSLMFKSCISSSCKISILEVNTSRFASLQGLPPEIIWNILKYCDAYTVCNFKSASEYFCHVCKDFKNFKPIATLQCPQYINSLSSYKRVFYPRGYSFS